MGKLIEDIFILQSSLTKPSQRSHFPLSIGLMTVHPTLDIDMALCKSDRAR
ncbi:MAG: hypothetical protein AAGD25_03180 [Cyanobacteria bacterium P01_F01_bin.150]